MFASFAKLSGFAAQWSTAADERFIVRTLSGDVHAIADMLTLVGVPAPAGKVTMLRFLEGDALNASPIKGYASGAWGLFCRAAAAALRGDRSLCDTFDTDAAASKAAASKAAADKRQAKAATVPAATMPAATVPAATVVTFVAGKVDPVAQALDVLNASVNAGTLTAEQVGMLRAMVDRLSIKV